MPKQDLKVVSHRKLVNDIQFGPKPGPAVRRPGEFEPHAKTWMAWPHRLDLYKGRLGVMQAAYAEIAKAIAAFEPVTMVAHPEHAGSARQMLGNAIEVLEVPIDDCWIRDSGPTYVTGADGTLQGVSWKFNAWGGKHAPSDTDDALAGQLLAHEAIPTRQSWLTCEGGSLCCDGEGTLIVTETSILHPNRNPGVGKALVTAELKAMLGVEKVIWLPGDPMDRETDGHVDGMCCFIRPGVVMFETNPDWNDPHARILAENLAVLRQETDAKGRAFEVIAIPEAIEAEVTSEIFARSYINYYLPNGGVIVPGYGTKGDAEAVAILTKAFPDRKVVQIDVRSIAPSGGAIHCITQEQPLAAGKIS